MLPLIILLETFHEPFERALGIVERLSAARILGQWKRSFCHSIVLVDCRHFVSLEMNQTDAVWAAFAHASITSAEGPWTGNQAIPLPLPSPCFVITACNPFAQQCSDRTNAMLHWSLYRHLRLRHPYALLLETIGHSCCNSWEEPSWAIYGISMEEACDIARHWRQLAFFHLSEEWLEIVDDHGQVRIKRPRNAGTG